MALVFILAALAFISIWHVWLEKRGAMAFLSGSLRNSARHASEPRAAASTFDARTEDVGGPAGRAFEQQAFVSDVAWLIFCAPIAVGLMLVGAAGLALWSIYGGPAWSLDLLWPWCGAIVLGVCYHGWSRERGSRAPSRTSE